MSEKTPSFTPQEQEPVGENMYAGSEDAVTDSAEQEDIAEYGILELDDPQLSFTMRRSYLRSTYRLTEKIQKTRPDYVIYLDKSGRPVAWLENELYNDFISAAAGEDDPHPKPKTLFLNIDREHWRDETGGKELGSGMVDAEGVGEDVIRNLRTLLLKDNPEPESDDNEKRTGPIQTEEDIATLPTLLDGAKVLIVDEVKFTGDTLKIAKKLLEAAVPEAEFETHHWMTSPKAVDPNAISTGLPDVPVWYRSKAEWGRGVANRNPIKSWDSDSWRQRAGDLFLSTRFDNPDTNSVRLRREMEILAEEYRSGLYGEVTY